MKLTNIWGEGAIFANSGLTDQSLFSDDFCGSLLKDKVGMKFYSSLRRYLKFDIEVSKCNFDFVSSDYISFTYNNEIVKIFYVKEHLIAGILPDSIKIFQEADNKKEKIQDDLSVLESNNEITILKHKNNVFYYAYAHNYDDAVKLIYVDVDFSSIEQDRINFLSVDHLKYAEYEELYTKCLSVMKTQIYTKEDKLTSYWSTPDRVPHKKMWLWDSVFHAIGFKNINMRLAEDLILAVLNFQHEDGFIPHMMGVNIESNITQPPVLAYGAWKVYDKSRHLKFIKTIFDKNKLFLEWVNNNRRLDKDIYLYTWNLSKILTCKCDESGMDNSPRFDTNDPLFAIDFSAFMANECIYMAKIAHELYDDSESYYLDLYQKIKNDMNKYLWDDVDHIYYDYNTNKHTFHKVLSVVSFMPLLANIPSTEQVEYLVKYLEDEETFNTPLPIPSIAKSDPLYGSDMWRGPVWINFNYMIREGLYWNNHKDLANRIKDKTIKCINKWYKQTGVLFEFFDSMDEVCPSKLNRKGSPVEPYNLDIKLQTIRDYGWTTTLLFDWLTNK